MVNIPKAEKNATNSPPFTFETMIAAINKLNEKPAFPEGHPFFGVIEFKENPLLNGSEIMVVTGDKAYYWSDIFNLKEVKVLRLPDFKYTTESLTWNL